MKILTLESTTFTFYDLMSRCPKIWWADVRILMSRCPDFDELMSGYWWADVPKKWWADVRWASVTQPNWVKQPRWWRTLLQFEQRATIHIKSHRVGQRLPSRHSPPHAFRWVLSLLHIGQQLLCLKQTDLTLSLSSVHLTFVPLPIYHFSLVQGSHNVRLKCINLMIDDVCSIKLSCINVSAWLIQSIM